MDDLDRMYRRLLHNIRSSYPEFLTKPFEVSELYQTLIPYRHNRRELEIETNQDYELALLRLLSGERGYLSGDSQMQADLREEVGSKNPDLSKFRAYATTHIALGQDGIRAAEPAAVRRPGSGGNPEIRAHGSSSEARAAQPVSSAARQPAADVAAAAARPTLGMQESTSAPTQPVAVPPLASTAAPSTGAGPAHATVVAAAKCRYCAGALPEGRKITFCPHCGQNLTIQHCPACGTELEIEWKFCTTCGRGVT